MGIYELHDHLERTEQLKQNISKVKENGAQITIVIFHWGNEKEEVPDSNQTTLGRLAQRYGHYDFPANLYHRSKGCQK